jgi:hypothetical protein
MTKKADFNAEEWSLVLEAPPVAGLIVMAADRGGMIRESMSMGRAYAEAQKEHAATELLDEIVSARPDIDPNRYKTPEELRERGLARITEAVNLLERKATPEETEGFKRFVIHLADTVAHAKKEGGVLGIGGKPVSEEERAALEEIASALRTEPPLPEQ